MMQPSERRRDDRDRIVAWLSHPGVEGATLAEYQADQVLYEPDQAADSVYYLLSGQVRIYQSIGGNAERLISILGRGSWLGVAALAERRTYGMRARVFAVSAVWSIPAVRLIDVLSKTPMLASSLVSQLASRLYESYETATRLVFQDCDSRIVQTLLNFSESAAAVPQDDSVVLQITHQELAQAVGAARETVSLALTTLRQQNLVTTGRNRLTFNPRVLRQFADTKKQTA
jgi:CRP/FNR family cyclic AMP-dependent transcriptional regulator